MRLRRGRSAALYLSHKPGGPGQQALSLMMGVDISSYPLSRARLPNMSLGQSTARPGGHCPLYTNSTTTHVHTELQIGTGLDARLARLSDLHFLYPYAGCFEGLKAGLSDATPIASPVVCTKQWTPTTAIKTMLY
jgi:hypothetical protein